MIIISDQASSLMISLYVMYAMQRNMDSVVTTLTHINTLNTFGIFVSKTEIQV